jgi:hypothetical protein
MMVAAIRALASSACEMSVEDARNKSAEDPQKEYDECQRRPEEITGTEALRRIEE